MVPIQQSSYLVIIISNNINSDGGDDECHHFNGRSFLLLTPLLPRLSPNVSGGSCFSRFVTTPAFRSDFQRINYPSLSPLLRVRNGTTIRTASQRSARLFGRGGFTFHIYQSRPSSMAARSNRSCLPTLPLTAGFRQKQSHSSKSILSPSLRFDEECGVVGVQPTAVIRGYSHLSRHEPRRREFHRQPTPFFELALIQLRHQSYRLASRCMLLVRCSPN